MIEPLTIGIVSVHTSPLRRAGSGNAGGLNVYALESARQLARQGHQVHIFTADQIDELADCIEIEPGLTAHQLGVVPSGADKDAFASHLDAISDALGRHRSFAQLEVIHSHYWMSGVAVERVRLTHQTHLITMHTMALVKGRDSGVSSDTAQRIDAERTLVATVPLIVNTSKEIDDAAALYGADRDHSYVVPPGVETTTFFPRDRAESRQRTDLENADLVVLYAGRLQQMKGIDVLLDAIAILRDTDPRLSARVHTVIVGGRTPTSAAALQQVEDELQIAGLVEHRESVDPSQLADLLCSADIVVVPSRSESFGLVAAESGACGIPVIASAVGGLPDVVDDGDTGLLVPPGNPRELAKAIGQLLHDDDRRIALGQHGAQRMLTWTWVQTATQLLAAYRAEITRVPVQR